MSARQDDDRQSLQAQGAQANGPAELTAWEGQAALAFSAPQRPLAPAAPVRPEPARPEIGQDPDDEAEVSRVAGASARDLLAITQDWTRELHVPPRLHTKGRGFAQIQVRG